MINEMQEVDVLAIGAHPDDVELGCGGILANLARQGKRVCILDLTQGEMGTRGSIEERRSEALHAAGILGISLRLNAGLPDGGLSNSCEQQRAVIPFIRGCRPRVLLALMAPDRHPDHGAAHALCRDANYYAGLKRIETGQEPHRVPLVYYYHPYTEYAGTPPCVVNISEVFTVKVEALRAYKSQFHNPDYPGPSTFIASQEFWEGVEVRARFWGQRIGTTYGEPLYADGPIPLDGVPGI